MAAITIDVLVDGQRCRIFWGQGFRVPAKINNKYIKICTLMMHTKIGVAAIYGYWLDERLD
jgi:hypothetical protein